MPVPIILSSLLRQFAEDRRRVVSDWRILIHCRRLARASNTPLPNAKQAVAIRDELTKCGDLSPVDGLPGVYLIETPFANLIDVSEEQILQESNPWAVFSHLTALAYHGLTDLIPSQVFATHFRGSPGTQVPLGTTPEDWVDLKFPLPRTPAKIRDVIVSWSETKPTYRFGIDVGYSLGAPILVTDLERSLLDALRRPDRAGGITKTLQAWKRADTLDLDRLVEYVDRFDIRILRQRVGFLLQTLGRAHPRLDQWRNHLLRGGSVLLDPGQPFADRYSSAWNLSLNVPESALAILHAE